MIRFSLAALLACATAAFAQPAPYSERQETLAFIQDMVKRHGFIESELVTLFSRVQRSDPVIDAIERPAEKTRPWREYRAIFLDEKRILDGIAFWQEQRRTLERAERAYGVPAEYIVAIIGVETFYGKRPGRHRVIDALATLAFDYPPRAGFFRSELENYLLFSRDRGSDVFAMRGSYAGAMGMPQFMPGSARHYGVDFDRDGHVDLRGSADAIGSVGNFLKQHGWRKGGPVLVPARANGEAWRSLAGGFEPKVPLAKWLEAGVELNRPSPGLEELSATPVELAADDFRLGFRNFYVLTRYNRSAMYAAAVDDLARTLRTRAPKAKPQSAGK
jgi:membrane-bound lytic murein transglycosylase B